MKYNVVKGNEVVKKNLSKKQAEEYCDKMNKEFKDKQESIRKQQHNAGTPLKKNKYDLYKVEVVKESKVIKLTESDLRRIVRRVIMESNESIKDRFESLVYSDDFLSKSLSLGDSYPLSEIKSKLKEEFPNIYEMTIDYEPTMYSDGEGYNVYIRVFDSESDFNNGDATGFYEIRLDKPEEDF